MRRHRTTEGLGLAFLDIMSCGLGAIILVFMLVKHHVDNSLLETELLKADLTRLQDEEKAVKDDIAQQEEREKQAEAIVAELSARIESVKRALKNAQSQLSGEVASKNTIEQAIKRIKIPKPPDAVEKQERGEEQYLIGLRVEGPRIAILLDSSASMTDEKLINVIRRKNASDKEKQAGPKWRRAKSIVHWILARLPSSSQVTLVTYSDRANRINKKAWVNGSDQQGLKNLIASLGAAVPGGGTNLQAGLSEIVGSGATDLYVITDGLPTKGDASYKSLNPFADCSVLWGRSSRISGTCRLKLFAHTLDISALRGMKVNVIMLPLEGDPHAAHAFWGWSASSRGLLISPAQGWP